jgi:hypothetical protein
MSAQKRKDTLLLPAAANLSAEKTRAAQLMLCGSAIF